MSLKCLTRKPTPEPVAIQTKTNVPNFMAMKANAQSNLEAEVKRIAALPITQHLSPEDVDMVSRHYLTPEAYAKGDRLRQEQALAMVHYNDFGGVFCTLGVGAGKTLISFMIANDCYKKIIRARQNGDTSREPRILLVVQANLLTKFEHDVPFMRSFLKELPPFFIMKGADKRKRTMIAKSGRRGLYVCSYHLLSSKDASDTLEAIKPACIICDEAQNVAGTKDSARARRFRSYVNQHQPEVVPLSGTMTRKSVMEYFFLSKAALGEHNFLPNSTHMAQEWANALDSAAPNMGDFRNDVRPRPGPISYLTSWCHKYFPDIELPPNLVGFRRAFAQRMVNAPGVICSTTEDQVGCGLVFSNNKCEDMEAHKGWPRLMEHLDILLNDYQTPSGEELSCAMNVWGYRYQMEATGFYYDLYWRDAEALAKLRKISEDEAEAILEKSREHHERHKEYQACLRYWLKDNAKPHLDTPALIGTNMKHNGPKNVGNKLYDAWIAWKGSAFDGMEVRQSRPVRVCDFKIKALADDVMDEQKAGGIIWYQHKEMGYWVMDELRERGLSPVHCPSELQAHEYLADTHGKAGTWVVACLGGHSTGKDLQHGFCNNYFLQVPVSASQLEQCLGRTHRSGQYAEEVHAQFYLCTDFDHAHFNAILNDTAYMQQTTTQKHKMLIGSYTFRPKSIPYTALQEMGASLSGKADRKLLEGIIED